MKITVLDGHTLNPGDNPWDKLGTLGKLTVYDASPADKVVARSEGAEILVVNKIRLNSSVLDQLPVLQFVAVTATGFDCVEVTAAHDRKVAVANVPEYGSESVAQHTMALLLHRFHLRP